MQSVLDQFLDQIAGLLGPLSPFAKAVVPAALGLAQLGVGVIITGVVSSTQLTVAVTSLVLAALAYLLKNKAKPAA